MVKNTPTDRAGEGAWERLRRRKVVQWAVGYAAAAWTLLQVIEYFGETYAWPTAIRQIAALALPLGTLLVLVLAWYHGDKGEQQVSRPEVAILAALALGIGAALWVYVARLDNSAWEPAEGLANIRHVVPKDAASVAVLPFVDMSEARDQEYFADGLSEEILNALAGIPGLYVPARTSSFQFKGMSGDVAKFAALLGVASVLEGSVRKSGKRVRITAQLVNARDGYHLWSQTFDRESTDIFAIQEEIARAIADALEIKLTAQQQLATARTPPTSNLDAYEEYLLGRFAFNKRGLKNGRTALAHFEKAIALDPRFALAHADLAVVEQMFARPEWDSLPGDERWRRWTEEPRTRVERALALDPERPEVLAAAGYVDFSVGVMQGNKALLERSLDYLERSLALWPNSGEALNWKAYTLSMLSRYEESIRALQEAAKRDPLNFIPVNNYAETLYLMGRTSEADVVVERVSAVNPLVAQDTAIHGELLAGNRAKGVRLALEVADPRQPGDLFYFSSRLQLATLFASLGLRDEVFGAEIFAEAFKINGWWQGHMLFYECREALALMENEERSTTHVLDEVLAVSCAADYRVVDEWLKDLWDPRTHWFGEQLWGGQFPGFDATLLLVADSFRRTGHEADAKVWRDIADRMISGKARAGYRNYFEQAMLYAYDGRDDEAVQKLIAAIRYGNHWRAAAAIPLVSPLTKRPEYQEAMKKEGAVLDRQRAEVLEMLCGPEPVSKTYKPAPATCAR